MILVLLMEILKIRLFREMLQLFQVIKIQELPFL